MDENVALRKLLRFLHYGAVEGVYIPSCGNEKKLFTEEKANQLRIIIAELDHLILYKTIENVIENNTTLFPEVILYVLAECARFGNLRPEAFRHAEKLCKTSKYFLLFFKFAFELPPKIGTGSACRKFISNWYLKKDSFELAKIVTETLTYKGWRHSDLIKLAHLKCNNAATGAVLCYLVKGIKIMNLKYDTNPKASTVVSYLNDINHFHKSLDESSIISFMAKQSFSIKHLNYTQLKSKQIWMALLKDISIDTLLDNLNLLCKLFTKDSKLDDELLAAVCDVLSKYNDINISQIQPSQIYIKLCEYMFGPSIKQLKRFTKNKKPKRKFSFGMLFQPFIYVLKPLFKQKYVDNNNEQLFEKPIEKSESLINILKSMILASYKNINKTDLRYVISVNSVNMSNRRCKYVPYMKANQAAAAIALTLFVSEPVCDIILNQPKVTHVHFNSKFITINDMIDKFTTTNTKSYSENSLGALQWAFDNHKIVDVFVIIENEINFKAIDKQLNEFRSKLIHSDFKLILCNLCSLNKQEIIDDKNVFIVEGFDKYVCNAIALFATGAF